MAYVKDTERFCNGGEGKIIRHLIKEAEVYTVNSILWVDGNWREKDMGEKNLNRFNYFS